MKEHKTFKPFDKVLVRDVFVDDNKWIVDLYSHYSDNYHMCIGMEEIKDDNILPYEGNEHLVGTTDESEEEVKLKEGEYVMHSFGGMASIHPLDYSLGRFIKINKSNTAIMIQNNGSGKEISKFIRFSDFNPNDMEETKKHILCVKNGKIVKYKG